MATHGMIDLETVDVTPSAVILTLGAIKFDPFSLSEPHTGLYLKLDISEQLAAGRTVSNDTIDWWAEQPESVVNDAFYNEDTVSMEDAAAQINKWLVGLDRVWAQGVAFDIPILESFMQSAGSGVNFDFWNVRDSRTILAAMPKDPRKDMQQDLHNALADAYYQAVALQKSLKHLNITKI
jgi:hypothetical protein